MSSISCCSTDNAPNIDQTVARGLKQMLSIALGIIVAGFVLSAIQLFIGAIALLLIYCLFKVTFDTLRTYSALKIGILLCCVALAIQTDTEATPKGL